MEFFFDDLGESLLLFNKKEFHAFMIRVNSSIVKVESGDEAQPPFLIQSQCLLL